MSGASNWGFGFRAYSASLGLRSPLRVESEAVLFKRQKPITF